MSDDEPGELWAMLARAQADADRPPDPTDPQVIAASRRLRRRRRVTAIILTAVVVAAAGTYLPLTLLTPTASATLTVTQPDVAQPAAVTLPLPDVGASAVSILNAEQFEGITNGILASSGGDKPRPIASISKLITTLVVLDSKPIGPSEAGPTLTFSKADAALYDAYYVRGATVQPMKSGSTMSLHDALELMLVVSACNYAEAVTTWAFGSQANFRVAAKAWLKANGLTGTTIVEPTGLDPRNVSTPADLITIGKLALANPVVAGIVGSKQVSVPNVGTLMNSNRLLLGGHGLTGLKTGTLSEAGACLLFSAVVDVGASTPITVVGVVLGAETHISADEAVLALLASIKSGFQKSQLVEHGATFGTYTTPWGDDALIVAGEGASALTWSNTPITSTMVTQQVTTRTSGSTVGSVTFVAGQTTVTVPLVLKGGIDEPDPWWRLTHPAELLEWQSK